MKVGDVVYLRKSGVAMTVDKRDGDHVACIWFGINARADWTGPHRRRFHRSEVTRSIRQIDPPPSLKELRAAGVVK
jgi:uncharacterized protein YodC (DUF2158 family)